MTTTPPDLTLIGLTGRAHTGKDTAADHLCARYGFMRASFAAPLKTMLEAWFDRLDVDYAYLHEPQLKNRPIPELGGLSARYLMQTMGTELGRRLWGEGIWVTSLARELGLAPGLTPVHDRIVLTDVRFPNEGRWVQGLGGRIIRLHRDQAGAVLAHESESHVDRLHTHFELRNDGPTLAGFHALLDGTMATLGIDEREPMPQTF